ncbi:MAG: sigma-70 family RNA polymerase sigma factor [Planctomycetes bacterium]|nr:sigma-70 family RNA polymerase sigma factor [Planctomycetota bacterium]
MTEPTDQSQLTEVHERLRALARRQMAGERGDHTLQATALVNEAWLAMRDRLDGVREDPGRFFGMAAEAMRRILIDHARKRGAKKRGGPNLNRLSLDLAEVAETADLEEVEAIDEAITALADVNARAAEIVRLRFFAGLDEIATGEAMNLSERTVRREWAFARAWLYKRLAVE